MLLESLGCHPHGPGHPRTTWTDPKARQDAPQRPTATKRDGEIDDDGNQGGSATSSEFSSINTTYHNNQIESVIVSTNFGLYVEAVNGGAIFLRGLNRIDLTGVCICGKSTRASIDAVTFPFGLFLDSLS